MTTTRPATHRCPGRCGRTVPNQLFACQQCWYRLPGRLQHPITVTAGWPDTPTRQRHADAMVDARDWYLAQPAPTPNVDAAITGWCEHCQAQLLWLTTATGKRMPVNADPDVDRGNVVRTGHIAGVLGPGSATAARATGTPLWLHHTVTCPYRDRWHAKPTPRTRGRRR